MPCCVFCCSNEGYICSKCIQKLLAMPEQKLEEAFTLAMERGLLQKAEVIGQLIGKDPEEYEREKRLELSKHNNRKQPLRSIGYQQKRTFRPKRKGVALHSSWKRKEDLPRAGRA